LNIGTILQRIDAMRAGSAINNIIK